MASFRATKFVESSGATLNMGKPSGEMSRGLSSTGNTLESSSATMYVVSPSGEISTELSSTGNTPESSSETINVVSPSGEIDVPLSYVTTRTVNVESSIPEVTSAALQSASQWVNTVQVITAPISTAETGVEATIESTVKPTITYSVNGKYVVTSNWL